MGKTVATWRYTAAVDPSGVAASTFGFIMPLNSLDIETTATSNTQINTAAYQNPNYIQDYVQRYKTYKVKASKIRIRYVGSGALNTTANPSGTGIVNCPYLMTVVPLPSGINYTGSIPTGVSTNTVAMANQKYAKVKLLNPNLTTRPQVVSHYMSVAKIDGVSKTKVDTDDGYSANTNLGASNVDDPVNQCVWWVGFSKIDNSLTTATDPIAIIDVTMKVYVEFTERQMQFPQY